MEIRVIEISNGYLIYSDTRKQPLFRSMPIGVKTYIDELVKEWVTKEIQKENE